MSDNLPYVDEIFCAAIELPSPEQRGEYVDRACGGNAELRNRVDALLAAHFGAGDFLERSPATALLPDHENLQEGPGTLIGPYKLLEQIGEGGMGVVYMADQQAPVRRRVALKVIKTGMDTRQVITRFEAERQALALMDHSNIARVLDAGATDSGRPYFVMELVRGVPITEYCDQNNLPVHERLELFVQVCSAVQHAHQKGIIHRDLKPSNVLVTLNDGRAVPKVIDFGVAKATGQQLTEKTLFTAFAQMVGTPLYMSPEQAEMTSVDIDTRSDIYSLGVLLYELLTGTTPFDQERMRSAAFDEIRRIIREEEPPKPSTRISTLGESRTATAAHRQVDAHRLGRLMEGDLDWIVMKALDKDRTRRYDTAGNFAADVLRHLSDLPVEACPPSKVYRFCKFARRNRMALLAICAVVTTLLLSVIGLAVSNRLIRAERNEKAAALALAEAHRQRAYESFSRTSIAISQVVTRAAMGLDEWSELPPNLRKKFSEEAVKFFESLLQQEGLTPDLRFDAAVAYGGIGSLHRNAGEPQAAVKSFERGIEIFDRLVTEYPENRLYRHHLAWAQYILGQTLFSEKRFPEAQALIENAVALYKNLLSEEPDSINYHSEVAHCYRALAEFYWHAGDRTRAAAYLKRAIEALNAVAAANPAEKSHAERLGSAYLALGTLKAGSGHMTESNAAFQSAAEFYEDAFTFPQYASRLFRWSKFYVNLMGLPGDDPQIRFAETEQVYRQFFRMHSRMPAKLRAHRDLQEDEGHVHRIWAFTLRGAGRLEEAEQAFIEGATIFDQLTVDEAGTEMYWPFAADTHHQIADLMFASGRHEEAVREFRRSIELYEHQVARFSAEKGKAERAAMYNTLAWLLATSPAPQQRNSGRAVELAEKAVVMAPTSGGIWNTLGVARYRAGDWQGAVEALGKSMELHEGGDASDWFFLAMAHWRLDHKDEARQWFNKALEWMDKNQPKNEELLHFRAEAAELLGISEPAKSTAPTPQP